MICQKVLLLGGDGFLGKPIQRELASRKIRFKTVDICDYNLELDSAQSFLVNDLKDTTHVVVLASKLGAKLFDTSPFIPTISNISILKNIALALSVAHTMYNLSYDVTFYSTSEVYGSLKSEDDFLGDHPDVKFDVNCVRSLYAQTKLLGETLFRSLQKTGAVSRLKVLHPFNVTGSGQIRGVVYEMIRSALDCGQIKYAKDTTRTITDLNYATLKSIDAILSKEDCSINIVENEHSLTMKALAEAVKIALESVGICSGLELIEMSCDTTIQYRHTSKPQHKCQFQTTINQLVIELADEIKETEQHVG